MLLFVEAYCTQQTGSLTRGITLRAMHAAFADARRQSTHAATIYWASEIACNTLPCGFTPLGLSTRESRGHPYPVAVREQARITTA